MLHEKIKIVRKLSDEEIAKRREEKALQEQKNTEKLAKKSTKNSWKNFEEKKSEKNFKKNDEKFEKRNFEKFDKNFAKKSENRDFKQKSEKNSHKNFEKSGNGKRILLKKAENSSKNKKFPQEKNLQKNSKIWFTKDNLKLFITCQAGLESLVKRDNEKIWLQNFEIRDRIVRATANEKSLYEALIWNRFSNRVYLEITSKKTNTFDELFDLVSQIDWKKFLPSDIAIVTEATAIKSDLSHTPSIQSITKKAIVNTLTEGTGTHHLYENRNSDEAHIQVFIIENIAYILLDITGNALHKRGWRTESGEAPIKESLAAAIVALSGWKFNETLVDPFCGSGTIAIEAALLARNIAPGLGRHFAIENFPFFNHEIFQNVRTEARHKKFGDKKYKIIARDLSEEVLQKAKNNAMRAGVEDTIIFEKADFFETKFNEKTWIVTNPPYNVRLEIDDEVFYKNFAEIFKNENISGSFITSFDNNTILSEKIFKNRKLYNGGLAARFYKKIP